MANFSRQLNGFNAFKEALIGPVPDILASAIGMRALQHAPKGDGHPVLVLPGFLSGDMPTWPLRQFLSSLGYHAWPWGLGLNLGFSTSYTYDIEALIEHRLKEIYIEASDQKISVIGWSLGGVYARELARSYPHLIKEVITLGSPINGNPADTSITRLFSWVTQMQMHDPAFKERIERSTQPITGVPVTALYSLDDNIVPPQCARETPGPLVQNIKVDCTHTGFGFSTYVYYLIAHRLAQVDGDWGPLDVEALTKDYLSHRMTSKLAKFISG
jgi:hypothetical protein